MLVFVFSCDPNFSSSSFSSSSSSVEQKEDPSKEQPKEIPIRKSIVSDKVIWNATNKTAEDQGPWQRKFELQFNSVIAKMTEGNIEKANFLATKYYSLTNVLKTNDVHPGLPLKNLNTIRIKNLGVKKYYADTNKTKIAKEEFFEMEQSILIFTKDEKTTNRIVYYRGKTNKVKENIYLENGKVKASVFILKNQNIVAEATSGKNSPKWAIYAAYYQKLQGQAKHTDTIKIPSNNSFKTASDALYGVEGTVKATLSSYNINTETTLKDAIFQEEHFRILKAGIVGESKQYNGDFLTPALPRGVPGVNSIVTFTFAFEDWKVPDQKNKGGEGSGDYNDGRLIVVIGRKKKISLANFNKMWTGHAGDGATAKVCDDKQNDCACSFSSALFFKGLNFNIEIWKKYMKSRSSWSMKQGGGYSPKYKPVTKNFDGKFPRVIRALEIFYFMKEVVFDGSFRIRRSSQSYYQNKKGIVFMDTGCFSSPPGVSHVDLWDGIKFRNKGGDSSGFPSNCDIYFLEFN